jgi:hypothetical protein
MATYDDLYIRSTLNDPGTIPRSGVGLSASPDIIPYGFMPVDNPVKFFSENFNQVVSKDLVYNAPNYVYLRGKNLYNGARSGVMYAYWAPSNLLLYPSTWQNNVLKTNNNVDHVPVNATASGAPYVTPEPLVWVPTYPPAYQHFCMISRVSTDTHPNPIPKTGGYSDFANWVANNGGIGWRNVQVVAAGAPELLFESNYDQGDEGGLMDVLITATDCPIGSDIWFSSGTALPNGTVIKIPPRPVEQNPQTWGTQAMISANWKTTFRGAYRSNNRGAPGPNFDVTLRVQYVPGVNTRLHALGATVESCGFGRWEMWDLDREVFMPGEDFYRATNKSFASGPVRPILLGAASIKARSNQ